MKTIFLFFFLAFAVAAGAQQEERAPLQFAQSISISPLAMLDVDNTILLGAEYRLKKAFSVLADAGYIYQSSYINEARQTRGVVVRPAVRFYGPRRLQNYAQVQLAYKMATYHIYDWLSKGMENEVPSYEQLQNFRFRKQAISANLMAGRVFRLFADRVYMDIYLGFGVKFKYQHLVNELNSRYNKLDGEWLNLYAEHMTTMNIPMGLKVSYILR